jgi:type I restriction enzyme S subunit
MIWPIKRLEEAIEINYGRGLPKDKRIDSGRYFGYGSNGPVCRTKEKLTDGETIVIGRKGAAGALYFVRRIYRISP